MTTPILHRSQLHTASSIRVMCRIAAPKILREPARYRNVWCGVRRVCCSDLEQSTMGGLPSDGVQQVCCIHRRIGIFHHGPFVVAIDGKHGSADTRKSLLSGPVLARKKTLFSS